MQSLASALLRVLAASAIAISVGAAQSDTTIRTDDRWRPFFGCWATASSYNMLGPTVCVVPTTRANIIELVSVVRDSIVDRALVGATSDEHVSGGDNCVVVNAAQWSLDQRRVSTRTVVTCAGIAVRQSSHLYTMIRPDAFTRIESMTADGNTTLRAVTFTALGDVPAVPADVKARLPLGHDNGVVTARAVAAADVKQIRTALRDAGLSRRMMQALLAVSSQPPSRTEEPSTGVASIGPCAHDRGNFNCSRYTPGGNAIGDAPGQLPPGSSRTNSLLGYESALPRGIP